jgi:hypothetical protein
MNFRAVLVALALGVASANRDFRPTASVSVGHRNIGSGLSADGITGDLQLESEVSDELKVGLEYDHEQANSGNPIKSVFARLSQKMAGGDVDADLQLSMGDNQLAGDVTYNRNGNQVVAHVNSNADNVVERVELTRGAFKGTYHTDSRNMDLEANADLDDDTNLLVKMSQGDSSAHLEINHHLDADTDVQVNMQPGADNLGASVEVTRRLDADNTVKPRFDINSKRLTCAWVRKLDAGRTATVNVDPDNSVDIEVASDNKADWSGKISAPWGNPGDADVKVSRQFSF